ncbi:hypothetical protein LCGC14_2252860 [marine sediment metagenome]|uniref:Uncharacterized protein n=1 Tax=marine sediment metagenome TaxID=412755 RepID=A0A0F9D1U1_9ZZZZ
MMYSTYPTIVHFTPAVLRAASKQANITPDEYRLGTLKRVETELGNLLDPGVTELHPDHRESLEDLHRQVRIAVGGA